MSVKAKEYCHLNIAVEKGDFNLCYNISNQGIKSVCLWNAEDKMYENIKKYETYDSCKKLRTPQRKKDCYFHFGTSLKNLDVCSKIEDNIWLQYCYGAIAQATKNTTMCNMIENKTIRENCLNFP